MSQLNLKQLPFLKSLCWQGDVPSIDYLSEAEIISIYERNWRLRGVVADLDETEKSVLRQLAIDHQSWLIHEI